MYLERLAEKLKDSEGLSLKLYTCPAGKLTIGYGHNIEDNGIPPSIADALLNHDINEVQRQLDHQDAFHDLDPERQMILADMCFNMGYPTLCGFKKMWAALQDHDYEMAADEMTDSRWYQQVTNRASELVQGMRVGKYPG